MSWILFKGKIKMNMAPVRNDVPTTLRDLGADLDVGARVATDQYGRLLIAGSTSGGAGIPTSVAPITPTVGTLDMSSGSNFFDFDCSGYQSVSFYNSTNVAATNVGFKLSIDGTNFLGNQIGYSYPSSSPAIGQIAAVAFSVASAQFIYIPTRGAKKLRVFPSATGTGTLTFSLIPSPVNEAINIDSIFPGVGVNNLGKAEDAASASGDVGISILGVSNEAFAVTSSTDGDYTQIATTRKGTVLGTLLYDNALSSSVQAVNAEDRASVGGDAGIFILGIRQDTPIATTNANGDYTQFSVDSTGALRIHEAAPLTFTHTCPSVTTATSFQLLASNTARNGLTIQNDTAANIMINLNNGTLTGIVPTSSNVGIVLTQGSSYTTPANATPTTAITCYQTSGSTVNTISVTEY